MSSSHAKNSRSDQLDSGVSWRVAQLVLSWPCLRKTMTMMMLRCGPVVGWLGHVFGGGAVRREVRKSFNMKNAKTVTRGFPCLQLIGQPT